MQEYKISARVLTVICIFQYFFVLIPHQEASFAFDCNFQLI